MKHMTCDGDLHVCGHLLLALIGGVGVALAPSFCRAQVNSYVFEKTYGDSDCVQSGYFGVREVTGTCQTGDLGYIAVGKSYPLQGGVCSSTSDVFVVRTDSNGVPIWENTYDVTSASRDDEGHSIVQLSNGSGFVIVGTTWSATGLADIFLMKIGCSGNVVWTRAYGSAFFNEWGADVIEAATGNGLTTFAGDLLVCGKADTNTPNYHLDGYLMRTSSGGVVVWGERVNNMTLGTQVDEWFNSLVELNPQPSGAGDVMAVGGRIDPLSFFTAEGYVVRVDGNTGGFTLPTHKAVDYGLRRLDGAHGADEFYSVIEVADTITGAQADVVLAGFTERRFLRDAYFVRLVGGDPAIWSYQTWVGDSLTVEEARCIRELPVTLWDDLSAGDLVVTGRTNATDTTYRSYDAFLISLNPDSLRPYPLGSPATYGRHNSPQDNEEGWSVAPLLTLTGKGPVVCGWTQSDWEGDGDPSDLYLVKPHGGHVVSGSCSWEWFPEHDSIVRANTPLTAQLTSQLRSLSHTPTATQHSWTYEICSEGGDAIARFKGPYLGSKLRRKSPTRGFSR